MAMKFFPISCLLISIAIIETGCVVAGGVLDLALTDKPRLARKARLNSQNLTKLKLGMTKEEALSVMGMPHKTEVYQVKNSKIELLSYLTTKASFEDHVGERHLTPIAIQNNKVIGWGRRYFDDPSKIISPE